MGPSINYDTLKEGAGGEVVECDKSWGGFQNVVTWHFKYNISDC